MTQVPAQSPTPEPTAVEPPPAGSGDGFARLHPLTPLLRGWAFLVAGGIAVGQQAFGDIDVTLLAVSGAAVMAFGVVAGSIAWWSTRYRIDADELRVESGVFIHRSRRIRIERLQAVDVVQPLAGRLLGLAEVRLEVAGGAQTEAPLAYLRLSEAHRVRSVLLARAADAPAEASSGPAEPPMAERIILTVGPGLLLAGLVLSTEFLVPVLGLAVVATALALTGQALALALLVPWLVAVGAVVLKNFIAQYGFSLHESANGLRIRRGLLDLRSQTVPWGRVQGIALVEPLLWRPRSWVRLEVDVAGYVGSGDGSAAESLSTLLPIATSPAADAVVARALPGVSVGSVPLSVAPRRAKWLRPIGWRFLAAGADAAAVVTTEGWLVRRTNVVPHAKAQSVRIRQGPVQRLLGLADVHVDSPPGPVHALARHRDSSDARALAMGQVDRSRAARQSAQPVSRPKLSAAPLGPDPALRETAPRCPSDG